MKETKFQKLKKELENINIHYINGDFFYSKSAENLPKSYDEYKNNQESYPDIDRQLSFELSFMVPKVIQIAQDGYVNELTQKPNEPNIPEKIILKNNNFTIQEEDVPDNLKTAGYKITKEDIILKVVKKDQKYNLVNYDGSRIVGTMLGGCNPVLRNISINDVTVCLDKDLEDEIKQLGTADKIKELKEIYKLANNSSANLSNLEKMSIFVHEATHANNSINETLLNNAEIKTSGKNINRSLEEEGFKGRNDEISAVFNSLRFEIKHYNKHNKPENIDAYSQYFKLFIKKQQKLPIEDREAFFNSAKEQLSYVEETWSKNQGAIYTTTLHSQILAQIERHSKYHCVFDIKSDEKAYDKTLSNYFNINDDKEAIDLSDVIKQNADFRAEYSYIAAMATLQQQTVDNRLKKLNDVGINEDVRLKMIELDKLSAQNNNAFLKERQNLAKNKR